MGIAGITERGITTYVFIATRGLGLGLNWDLSFGISKELAPLHIDVGWALGGTVHSNPIFVGSCGLLCLLFCLRD